MMSQVCFSKNMLHVVIACLILMTHIHTSSHLKCILLFMSTNCYQTWRRKGLTILLFYFVCAKSIITAKICECLDFCQCINFYGQCCMLLFFIHIEKEEGIERHLNWNDYYDVWIDMRACCIKKNNSVWTSFYGLELITIHHRAENI